MRRGVLHGVFNLLEAAGSAMSNIEKLVVLQYDEVKVHEKYEYDKKNDEIVGPHRYLQVVNARSLCGKWKQPIFADFDQKITKDILNTLCVKLHEAGFRVVACVSDCGPTNTGLWTILGVSWQKPWIKHPCIDRKIFFFADAPHMLKLVRNWLLDSGFLLKNGEKVTKEPLLKLIANQKEVSSIHKLTRQHVDCQGPSRQRVSLAAQLLSHTTSTALFTYGEEDLEFKHLAEFIAVINNWFDIMNSYIPSAPIPTKCGYGRSDIKKSQDDCLDKAFDTVLNMRCTNKSRLQIFQKGILLSIKALQQLFVDLQSDFNLCYILTHKVNQDALENLFSQIRTRGGLNDHPSPLDALHRLRMIILGKTSMLQTSANTVDQVEHEEYIVGKVLKRAGVQQAINVAEISNADATSSDSSTNEHNITIQQNSTIESDGLEYLAGWIAKKLKATHPQLGSYTYKNLRNMPTWVSHLSYGGLIQPSEEFMAQIQQLEKLFSKYIKKGFKNVTGINKLIVAKISKECDVDDIIIRAFVRQRIFIKINFLNIQYKNKKIEYHGKRKRDDRQASNKLKRLTM